MEVEETFKSLVVATTSANGGNWETGFNCPSIMLSLGAGKLVDQGPALIQGAKLAENSTDNFNGLVLQFEKPIATNSLIAQISTIISGNKIYIPWRILESNFVFVNPWFDNKYVKGAIKTDSGVAYNIKINFPYAMVGTWISDDKGNAIRARINTRATNNHASIRMHREYIKRQYPAYINAKRDEINLAKGQGLIDGKIVDLKAQIEVINTKNLAIKNELVGLNINYNREYVNGKAADRQVAKVDNDISENNASVKAMSDSIKILSASKLDPSVQQAAATKKAGEHAASVEIEYATLIRNAEAKMSSINSSKAAWLGEKKMEYKTKLKAFFPQ